jgi:hypothetical protein
MTEPSAQRPVPGPPRPGPVPSAFPVEVQGSGPRAVDERAGAAGSPPEGDPLAGLDGLPVAEHVAVFEIEHERLQRGLSTIDPL